MNILENDGFVTLQFEDDELYIMLENLDREINKVIRGEFSVFNSFYDKYTNMNILINFWLSLKEGQIKMDHC